MHDTLSPTRSDARNDEREWNLLDSVLQGSPIATFVIDSEHRVIHWNRACEIITGVPAARVLGTQNQWQGFYPEPRPVLADLIVAGDIEKALVTYEAGNCRRSAVVAGAYEAEGFFQLAGGRWLFFTAAPVLDGDGAIIAAIETLQDISERKGAELLLQAQCDQLAERVSAASSTAMLAMSSMGEMGVMLQVLRRFNEGRCMAEIAWAVVDGLEQYGLAGSVQVRRRNEVLQQGTSGVQAPLDAAIFAHLSGMGRQLQFHSRMIVNYERVSLILHNVPTADQEKAGRIRDNVTMLVEAADARIAAIVAEEGANTRQAAIVATIEEIGAVLGDLSRGQQQALAAGSIAIHEMTRDLEKLFVQLGLTEGQEQRLLQLVHAGLDRISAAQADQLQVRDALAGIIRRLDEAAGKGHPQA